MAETIKKVAKKTAAKKETVKKTATKKCAKKCVKTVSKRITRILAKVNVGWGNCLYIRGAGAELSWDKGVVLQCVGEDEWIWEQFVPKGDVTFKLLINDSLWSVGEDYVVSAGDTIICKPEF